MKKILVVDDDLDIVSMLKKRLEAKNYNVITAMDGREGLAKACQEKPDLILLDIIMPNKDGFTMLKELKAQESVTHIPVIILSAKGETDTLLKGEELEATDYFIKPCDFEELLQYIKKYI